MTTVSLYGLTVDSDLDLPGFAAAEGEPEVVVRCGTVPTQLEDPTVRGVCFQASPGQFLLQLEGVARYSVVGGRTITIERAAGTDDEDVRTFLLGTVLSAVLYQRGLVPFHASAVLTPGGAALFGGRSGVGKSTLAAAMARRGYPVITDDVAAVTLNPHGAPVVFAGSQALWLWGDALTRLGIPAEALGRVRRNVDKHVWPANTGPTPGPIPVVAYYHLDWHNQPTVVLTRLHGMERARILSNEIYRATVGKVLAQPITLFRTTMALAQHARVTRVQRPNSPNLLEQLVDSVVADLSGGLPADHDNPSL